MNKSIVLYLLLAGLLTCFSCTHTKQQPEEEGVDSEWLDSLQHVYQYGICIDSLDVTEYKMRNGDNPAAIFSALGFSALKADSITKASIHVLNPTKLRAGMNYYTFTTQDSVADIRYIAFAKSLADLLYTRVSGIKAHRLAFKIFESTGETEFSDEETGMIHMAVERYCLPNVIDALNEILGGSETDKNE